MYEGSENCHSFFRSSLRSLMVHNILINLDYNDEKETKGKLIIPKHKSFSLSTFSTENISETRKGRENQKTSAK